MRNSLVDINSRLDCTNKTNEYEDIAIEIIQSENENGKKKLKERESFSELWDRIKQTITHVIGVPEGKEREGNRQKKKS